MSIVSVTLVSLGSDVRAYEISANPTVRGLLAAAGKTYSRDMTITSNGNTLDLDSRLRDKDTVVIGRTMKGNDNIPNIPFVVELIRLGAMGESISAIDGMTISEALNQFEPAKRAQYFRADGSDAYEYRYASGGAAISGGTRLYIPSNGGSIRLVLSQAMKGNRREAAPKVVIKNLDRNVIDSLMKTP
jgi:hypothetical protein